MERQLKSQDDGFLSAIDAVEQGRLNELVGWYTAHLKGNPRLAWRCLSKKKSTAIFPARTNKERLQRFHVHFSKLLSAAPLEAPNFPPLPLDLHFNTGPFSMEELDTALKSLRDDAAAGMDTIQNPLLKLPHLRPALLRTVNGILNDLDSPSLQELRTTILCPLPKKGDLSDTGNWRGISLEQSVTKLFNALLRNRLVPLIDPHLLDNQNGFRSKRGTTEHVMCLRSILDLAQERKGYPLHGLFVDFKKAFDSVSWTSIEAALRIWHVPPKLIKAIFAIMNGHTVRVRSEGELGAPIAVTVGVLQGDTLAPFLFILVLDLVIRQVMTAVPDSGVAVGSRMRIDRAWHTPKLAWLAYADDVALLAHTPAELQALYSSLQHFAAKVGLQINLGVGKTEYFCVSADPAPPLSTNGTPVTTTTIYKYLGVYVLNFEDDFNKRKGKAWAALHNFSGLWHSSARTTVKRNFFASLIEPIFTYGLTAWPLSHTQLDRLDSTYGRMLRFALGLAPAYESRHQWPSTRLYGDLPYLSTRIRTRRLGCIAHLLREHFEGRTRHPLAELLVWDPPTSSYPRRTGGQLRTFRKQLFLDAGVDNLDDFLTIVADRNLSRSAVQQLNDDNTARKLEQQHRRRSRAPQPDDIRLEELLPENA